MIVIVERGWESAARNVVLGPDPSSSLYATGRAAEVYELVFSILLFAQPVNVSQLGLIASFDPVAAGLRRSALDSTRWAYAEIGIPAQ